MHEDRAAGNTPLPFSVDTKRGAPQMQNSGEHPSTSGTYRTAPTSLCQGDDRDTHNHRSKEQAEEASKRARTNAHVRQLPRRVFALGL